eukprot:SAG11_NODE_26453_length_345_cov_0.634146_1_plen_82_part_00
MAFNRTGGKQVADPGKFPNGMAALSRYVHDKGLKFGLYSARCKTTCQKRAASWGFQSVDAQQYADWNVCPEARALMIAGAP